MDPQRLQVLLVSSSAEDLDDVRRLLAQTGVGVDLHVARDGAQGARFLRHEEEFAGAAHADLALLDLALPDDGALVTLRALREDEATVRTQVLAITDEDEEAQLAMVADFPLHDVARRPLDVATLRRAITYFGEL